MDSERLMDYHDQLSESQPVCLIKRCLHKRCVLLLSVGAIFLLYAQYVIVDFGPEKIQHAVTLDKTAIKNKDISDAMIYQKEKDLRVLKYRQKGRDSNVRNISDAENVNGSALAMQLQKVENPNEGIHKNKDYVHIAFKIKKEIDVKSSNLPNIEIYESNSVVRNSFFEGSLKPLNGDGAVPFSNNSEATTIASSNIILVTNASEPGFKTVLFYTDFFGGSWSKFLRDGRTELSHQGCPVSQCNFIFDRSKISEADAVVFHASSFDISDLPASRHPDQRYIWMNVEAPCLNQKTHKEKYHGKPGFFNWTATYHRKSEVAIPYGGMVPLEGEGMQSRLFPIDRNSVVYQRYVEKLHHETISREEGTDQLNATFLRRPKLLSWMVSHCDTVSGREIYAKELQKYIPVDTYGTCGTLKCGRNHMDAFCYRDVLRPNYKFYLSFENSMCEDYITEKVWLPLLHGVVPVVYGGARYSDYLPPHSYIDATLLSPKELAKKLVSIASSEQEYSKYHLWRQFWRVSIPAPFCDLCDKLHNDVTRSHIDDLGGWWGSVNNCTTKYPESQYPRPNAKDTRPFLTKLGNTIVALNNLFQGKGR